MSRSPLQLRAMLIVGAFLLVSTSAQAAGRPTSFTSDWECREALLTFPVPVENVRDRVPSQFAIAGEESGTATFAVFAEHCLTRIDDGRWFPHVLSGAFLQLDGPSEPLPVDRPGFEFLWGTDDRRYYRALHRLGAGDYVPGSTLELTTGEDQVLVSEADIPWKASPFSFTLVTGEPEHPPQPITSIHIIPARKGYVWSTYPHMIEVSAGTGVLQLTPGTLLAEIAGSDTVTGAGLFGEFTIEDATTELRR